LRCIRHSTYWEATLNTITIPNSTTPPANSALMWMPLALPPSNAMTVVSVSP